MATIDEEIQQRGGGPDDADGFRIDVTIVDAYLKKLMLCFRILISVVLVLSLVTIGFWNFFAPANKDLSDRVRDKFLNGVNTENNAGLVAEGDSGRISTIPPNDNS